MDREEMIKKIQEIIPGWIPLEERSEEEQEESYDRMFDWDE